MRKVVTTYFCDRCGAEIKTETVPVFRFFQVEPENGAPRDDTDEFYELCNNCRNYIKKVILSEPFKEQPKQMKKVVDTGKIHALRDAGWTIKAISEEMKCSEATVYNHLNKKVGEQECQEPS